MAKHKLELEWTMQQQVDQQDLRQQLNIWRLGQESVSKAAEKSIQQHMLQAGHQRIVRQRAQAERYQSVAASFQRDAAKLKMERVALERAVAEAMAEVDCLKQREYRTEQDTAKEKALELSL